MPVVGEGRAVARGGRAALRRRGRGALGQRRAAWLRGGGPDAAGRAGHLRHQRAQVLHAGGRRGDAAAAGLQPASGALRRSASAGLLPPAAAAESRVRGSAQPGGRGGLSSAGIHADRCNEPQRGINISTQGCMALVE